MAVFGGRRHFSNLIGISIAACVVAMNHTEWAAAQDQSAPTPPPIRITTSAAGGAVYRPDHWGDISLIANNSTDEDVNLLVTTFVEPNPNLQYGRRFWAPAHARRRLALPIQLTKPDERESMTLQTSIFREGAGESTILPQEFGAMQRDLFIRVSGREMWTGIIDDEPNRETLDIAPIDLIKTARFESNMTRSPIYIADRPLSATRESFDPFSQLLVADARIADDAAAVAAIRSWLFHGGHLWVMLDRTGPGFLERLLGNDFDCQIVDRVGLTDVELVAGTVGAASVAAVEYERPVDLVRVVQNGFTVSYSTTGWPAALVKTCGAGQLIVSTLAADGWVQPRKKNDPVPAHGQTTTYVPNGAFTYLGGLFLSPPVAEPIPPDAAQDHVRTYVGYSIPARSQVLGILGGFTGLLVVAGLWLARMGRLELLGIVGPIAGVLAGGALVQAGNRQRDAIASKTAVVQFIEPMTGTKDVLTVGQAGLYLTAETEEPISGTGDGAVIPDMTGQEQTARRLVWTDLDRWRWENVRTSPGLRFASFTSSWSGDRPVEARATVNEKAISGTLAIPDGLKPEDGVLVTSAGRLAVRFDGQSFTSGVGEELGDNQFSKSDVITDEQARRAETLKQAFAAGTIEIAESPRILFWTQPWDMAVAFPSSAPMEGAALVSMPVKVDRPAAGQAILLPSAWLPFRSAIGPDGAAPSGFYDNRKQQFPERADPTSCWLRFQPPPALAPYAPRLAHGTIRVSGPVGKLEVAGFRDGQIVPIQSWIDPIGTLTFEVADPTVIPVDGQGGFFLRLAGGDPSRPELTHGGEDGDDTLSYWRVESLDLNLEAEVLKGGPSGLPTQR